LRELQTDDLDSDARDWVRRLKDLMDTSGVEDNGSGRGTSFLKAEQLTEEQKSELTAIIDELAHWFASEFWRGG